MTSAALLVLVLVTLVVRLAAVIRADGLGHRLPPRSHHDWTEDVPGTPRR